MSDQELNLHRKALIERIEALTISKRIKAKAIKMVKCHMMTGLCQEIQWAMVDASFRRKPSKSDRDWTDLFWAMPPGARKFITS